MPRPTRYVPGGMVFHVLNRGVGRRNLFDKDEDFLAFGRVMDETLRVRPMRICAYCLMSNHWHFVLWPEHDGDLPAFMQQLTNTHVKRWKEHRHETGYGHLYQGRSSLGRLAREDSQWPVLTEWPLPRPGKWAAMVNEPQTEAELAALRHCVNRGTPLGDEARVVSTSSQLGLKSTLRPRG